MDYKYKYLKYKTKYLKTVNSNNNNSNDLLENNTAKFVDNLITKTPLYKMTPQHAQRALNDMQHDESYKKTVDISQFYIEIEDFEYDTLITIFKPKNARNLLKTVVYFHGGGWVLGNHSTHGRLMSTLSVDAHVAVVFVDYINAPKAHFPIQVLQCYYATEHICTYGSDYGLDVEKIILAGDSVGGGFVTAVYLLATQNNNQQLLSHIRSHILLYPVTTADFNTASFAKYSNGPWLTLDGMKWFFDNYEPNPDSRTNIEISPLNANYQLLKNMPDTLIITVENDVLRDQGEIFAHKLMKVGVNVTSVRFLGTIHDFMMLDALKDTPAAIAARNLVCDYIKRVHAQ